MPASYTTSYFWTPFILLALCIHPVPVTEWNSKFITLHSNGSLTYIADEKGNTIPDFSRVGYFHGNKPVPVVPVVETIQVSDTNDYTERIQTAINAVAKKTPDANGFRGAVLLKKGIYRLSAPLQINTSGVVLRGEGNTPGGTSLIATGTNHHALIQVTGNGSVKAIASSRVIITDSYVATGAFSFRVSAAGKLKAGDKIIIHYHFNDKWINDIQMNQIVAREGTQQWKAENFDLQFERRITKVDGNIVFVDNPVVMAIDAAYGNAEVYAYNFEGRIQQVGIENLYCESVYNGNEDEAHSWDAISFNKIENGWIKNVTSRYFSFSCVNLGSWAKNISVLDSYCFDAKSKITGGRRYSFNNNGQQNLFINCHTTEGRHDFVTGARVCGPNVFVHCTAKQTHADIGPHHRWSAGTLYDNITTDGEINVQDRGNWGSGHGWAGVTQVLWNCTVKQAAVQSPWASGKNYCIGLKGEKYTGRFTGRPDAEWEGQNKEGLQPASLYKAQLKARGL